jgi:putative hydrolase of the HAD superfamily
MKYRHVFFDLDRTLWDFDHNSAETLTELFHSFNLKEKTDTGVDEFLSGYQKVNEALWAKYRAGTIEKAELRSTRFRVAFEMIKISDGQLADRFAEHYIRICPRKTTMLPGAHELLGVLKEEYVLHIITNGFEETQHEKMGACGIDHFFEEVITSEVAGARKPHPRIFELALSRSGAQLEASIMIGDDLEADVRGAQDFGMDQIHFCRNGNLNDPSTATHTVNHLDQILSIL